MIDLDDSRLQVSQRLGVTSAVNSGTEDAVARVLELTGGRIANIGVHGKPVQLHIEKLWDRNIAITTRLVDGSPRRCS